MSAPNVTGEYVINISNFTLVKRQIAKLLFLKEATKQI